MFDSAGDHLRTCKPDPTEIHGDVSLPAITVNDRGEVYLRAGLGSNRAGGYIHFSTSCERMGNNGIGGDASRLKWFSQPGTGRIWGLGYENIVLLDSSFAPIRTIKQRPDGHWLERPHSAGVAPNGSIAVVACSKKMGRDDSATVNLYDAEGEPLRTVQIPKSMGRYLRVAYDGEHLIVAGKDGILSFSTADNSARRFVFDYESSKEPYWYPFIVSHGQELMVFDGNRQAPELLRFRLP